MRLRTSAFIWYVSSMNGNTDIARSVKWPWSFIPLLTFMGFLSGIYTDLIWFLAFYWLKSEYLFVLLASVSLGLSLLAVLWFYKQISSWKIFASLAGLIVTVHFFDLFAGMHMPQSLRNYVDLPFLGTISPEIISRCSLSSFILFAGFLALASPKCKGLRVVLPALGCSALAAVTVAFVDGTQRDAWVSFWTGKTLGLLWQITLAFFLGIAIWAKQFRLDLPVLEFSRDGVGPPPRNRFAAFGILLVYLIIIGFWHHSAVVGDAKWHRELEARSGREDLAVGKLRRITTLQKEYAGSHPTGGFACRLSSLKQNALTGTVYASDAFLTSENHAGYRITLVACEPEPDGVVRSYQITAVPLERGKSGVRAFCTDQTGAIWYDENGSAETCLVSHRTIN
jgi:hypothetical protein